VSSRAATEPKPFGARVLVTGSAGLIGRAVVHHLEQVGWNVVGVDLASGHDVGDEALMRSILEGARYVGLINAFGHNPTAKAGATPALPFLEYSTASFDEMMATNVTLTYSVCREFLLSQASGSLINLSSIHAQVSPTPGEYVGGDKHPAYGASKAATETLTAYLARHAGADFRINCLRLGGVDDYQPAKFRAAYASRTVAGRMALPQDFLGAIDFLLSDGSRYITGQTLAIDGGWSL
jgi:NAD(P)-dependent dehydrogenase (short-subunit alcohol dehydrogenase family)